MMSALRGIRRRSRAAPLLRVGIALLALPALAGGLPSAAQASLPPCTCSHLDDLMNEIERTRRMQTAYAAKAVELRRRRAAGDDAAAVAADYQQWMTGIARDEAGPSAAGGGTARIGVSASNVVEYEPLGFQKIGNTIPYIERVPTPEARRKVEQQSGDLCAHRHYERMVASLEPTAACRGALDAAIAHEEVHRATCTQLGFYAFYARETAEKADDEVRAYARQQQQLEAEVERVTARAGVVIEGAASFTVATPDSRTEYSVTLSSAPVPVRRRSSGDFVGEGTSQRRSEIRQWTFTGGSCRMTSPPLTETRRLLVETRDFSAFAVREELVATSGLPSFACSGGGMPATFLPQAAANVMKLADGAAPGTGLLPLLAARDLRLLESAADIPQNGLETVRRLFRLDLTGSERLRVRFDCPK